MHSLNPTSLLKSHAVVYYTYWQMMKPMICHCMFTWCHWHVLSSWYVVFLNIWLVKFDYLTTTRQYIVIAFRYTFQRSSAEFAQVLGAAMFMINIGGWFVKRGWRQKSLNGKGREILESCFGLPPIMWREQLVAKEFQNLQDYWRGGVYHIALGGRLAHIAPTPPIWRQSDNLEVVFAVRMDILRFNKVSWIYIGNVF